MARCSRNECRRWRPDALIHCAKVGLWLDTRWFCSDGCLQAAAARRLREVRPSLVPQPSRTARLGALLVHQGSITVAQLTAALAAQQRSGRRLGAELLYQGFADREAVLRALAAQNGVSYLASIDPAIVRHAPGALSGDEARALNLVPFRAEPDRLLVACTAPVPRTALAALGALIGCSPEPYLVADADFAPLMDAYCAAAASRSVETTTAHDWLDGASRIAAVASVERAVTVTEARIDPFTWVRIAANGRIRALLVPPFSDPLEENPECLAATTPH